MGQQTSSELQKDLTGQVVLITGANTGIGKQTALRLAQHNATLILACRNYKRTHPLIDELEQEYKNIQVQFVELDLSDLNSVVRCAEFVKKKYQKIDILVNNAGVCMSQREVTHQGFEMGIGVNHFGHFVLTNQLLPLIKKSSHGKIISLSSIAHDNFFGSTVKLDLEDLNFQKREFKWLDAYGQSKLANILFIKKLQTLVEKENTNIVCVSIHPGCILTEIARHIYEDAGTVDKLMFNICKNFFQTPKGGSDCTVYCCLEDHEKLVKGAYYIDSQVHLSSKVTYDPYVAEEFWDFSNKQVQQYVKEW